MPHKNWRFGTISPSTPLRHDPDSPSSPCSPLHPIRPRPTAFSRPLAPRACVGSIQFSCSDFTPPSQTPALSMSSLATTTTSSNSSTQQQPPSPASSSSNTSTSIEIIPPFPQHWQWKCHLCSRRYNLGTTRRCLEDGHLFCSRPITPSSHPPPTPPPPLVFASEKEGILYEKAKRKREKKAQRTRQQRASCKSEFDYGGWKWWNLWRDDARNKEVGSRDGCQDTRTIYEKQEERRDCWNNCAYPSECLQKIQLAAEATEVAERERVAAEEEEKEWNTMVYGYDFHSDDQLREMVSTERTGRPYIVDATSGEEMLGMQIYAPFEHEYENVEYTNKPPEDLYIKTEHLAFEEEPVEIDPDDGLSIETESIFLHLCNDRRRFVDGGAVGSVKIPSSPLKTSFGFEQVDRGDVKMGGDLNLDAVVVDDEQDVEERRGCKCRNCRMATSAWESGENYWFCGVSLEGKEVGSVEVEVRGVEVG